MPDATPAPFHIGLTPERVVAAAVDLTRESHLSSWSLRDLARRLGVAPSVIYYHVGGKDLLSRRVVEVALAEWEAPPAGLEWREWFREALYGIGPVAARYPGVAKWLLMHGPTFDALMPAMDAGIDALARAGFGRSRAFAYAALLNAAMLTVSLTDDRLEHEEDGPRDHEAMMAEFGRLAEGASGARAIAESLILPFARGGEEAARAREAYYRFVIETTLAGLEARLASGEFAVCPDSGSGA